MFSGVYFLLKGRCHVSGRALSHAVFQEYWAHNAYGGQNPEWMRGRVRHVDASDKRLGAELGRVEQMGRMEARARRRGSAAQ